MSVEEFREEFSRLFKKESEEFFNKIYGLKKGGREMKEQDLMSMKEVADFFNVSRVTLSNWVKNGKINSEKKGNQRFFSRDYVEKYKEVNFKCNERLPSVPAKYF